MNVSLNLKPVEVPEEHRTLGAVINYIESGQLPTGQVLHRIVLDGEVLEEADEQAKQDLPVGEIEMLEFYSARPIDLTLEGFNFATEILPSLAEDLQTTATDIRSGNIEEGLNKFGECLSYIGWFITLSNSALEILGRGGQQLAEQQEDIVEATRESELSHEPPPERLAGIKTFASMENLRQKLNDLETVQRNQDTVLLADLLEYELLPIVRLWESEAPQVRQMLEQEKASA
jgi:hypothetical protein